ncbi:hypothetical protein CPB83DRAFT_855707 [Crepidotus variabilis]|uniref:Uncharacterized protein n=1 Tax=Crepidotus variabilis TaxID=179855 RepID=A0A9P6EEV9_9AGAR|nr:hypothetical protein CPB83DRAFT_855707 [Crepidotus variabilis]
MPEKRAEALEYRKTYQRDLATLQATHIIPECLCNISKSELKLVQDKVITLMDGPVKFEAESQRGKVHEHSAMWTMLQYFGGNIETNILSPLARPNVYDPSNLLTLRIQDYQLFDKLHMWFELLVGLTLCILLSIISLSRRMKQRENTVFAFQRSLLVQWV